MFEEYLIDSYYFYEQANTISDDREVIRYLRASIFYVASAIESFANFIGDTFYQGESLSKYEIAFLLDKKIVFDHSKIETKEVTEYHRIEDKLRILIKKFSNDFDFNSSVWSNFITFKKFRDSLVHPREGENEISHADYRKQLENGMYSIITLMNTISKGIFGKPLRKKLLDLIP